MFESIKAYFGKDRSKLPNPISVRVLEVSDYDVDFQLVQGPDKLWSYYLEIYPIPNENKLLEEYQHIEDVGHIELVEDVTGLIMPGKERYIEWEYAAETVIDVIELLGFDVYQTNHTFEVAFWNDTTKERDRKLGFFDGHDFHLAPIAPSLTN